MRTAPVQVKRGSLPHPPHISWETHKLAWQAYDEKWHCGQSAQRIAERGGFDEAELDEFLPDWREREARLAEEKRGPWVENVDARIAIVEGQLEAARKLMGEYGTIELEKTYRSLLEWLREVERPMAVSLDEGEVGERRASVPAAVHTWLSGE